MVNHGFYMFTILCLCVAAASALECYSCTDSGGPGDLCDVTAQCLTADRCMVQFYYNDTAIRSCEEDDREHTTGTHQFTVYCGLDLCNTAYVVNHLTTPVMVSSNNSTTTKDVPDVDNGFTATATDSGYNDTTRANGGSRITFNIFTVATVAVLALYS